MKPCVSDMNGHPFHGALGSCIGNELYAHACAGSCSIIIEDRKLFRKQQLAVVVREGGTDLNATQKFLRSPQDSDMDIENNGGGHNALEDEPRAALALANEGEN